MRPSSLRKWVEPSTLARLWALSLGGLLLVWGTVATQISSEESKSLQSGPEVSHTLARAYARQLEDLIDQSDQLLLSLSYLAQHEASADELDRLLKELPTHSWLRPYYVDVRGTIHMARPDSPPGQSVSDLDFFIRHQRDTYGGLMIHPAAPGVGALAGEQVVRLTRRVQQADGRFAGVVVVPIPVRVLTPQHASPGDLMYDLAIIGLINGPVISSVERRKPAAHGSRNGRRTHGTLLGAQSLENAERQLRQTARDFTARARLERHEIEVLVAVNGSTLLAPLEQERNDLTILGLVTSFVLLALTGWASWRMIRRRAAEEQGLHAWSVFRQAVDESNDEFFMLTPAPAGAGQPADFQVDDCNAQAARSLGMTREAIVGRQLSTLVPVADWPGVKDFLAAAFREGFSDTEARFPGIESEQPRWMYCRATAVDGSLAVTLRDVTELKEKERQLSRLALTDGLTGLPNRHWVNQRLPAVLKGAAAAQQYVAALFIDLDNFKTINDTLGHKVGDDYLRTAAACIQQVVRESDVVIRLGGDEFLVLALQLEDPLMAHEVAAAIIQRIREVGQIGRWSAANPRASIGIAGFPFDARDANDLVQAADIAMYEAKRLGKDRYQFYEPTMRDRLREDHSLEAGLRRAIADQALSLRLLPRASAATGRLVGFEALLRWDHPTLGSIPPNRFIPVAEKYELIDDLGCWVVQEIAKILAEWREIGKPPHPISINVSAHQLRTPRLREQLYQCAEQFHILPSQIDLELKESVIVAGDPVIKHELSLLRRMGHKLIIDDFGTGFSSLVQLQGLRIDMLKIDTSFTRNLSASVEGALICRAMVQIGKTLGVDVVAEGVEQREQFDKLQQYGCDEVQGYLVAEPLQVSDATALMEKRELVEAAGRNAGAWRAQIANDHFDGRRA